jgi:hypothetical protein
MIASIQHTNKMPNTATANKAIYVASSVARPETPLTKPIA